MSKRPGVAEVRRWLDVRDPLGLWGAEVEVVSDKRNHLIYRVTKGGRTYALRTINPESYRRKEWISMADEFAILRAIEPTGLGPKAYALEEGSPGMVPPFPFLIQEYVQATCFNDLKPLTEEHFVAAARAIAELNRQDISPKRFPFMRKYVRRDYAGSGFTWYYRLFDSLRRMPRRDVLRWVFKILPLIPRTMAVLYRSIPLLPQEFTFHFDGAHCENTYWRGGKVIFLDWQKVSWRNDPTFTLIRFATSAGEKGIVPEGVWQTLIEAHNEVRPLPNFGELAWVRLLERQTADLVWVLWDAARRRDRRPVEQGTSVVQRYRAVQEMLRTYR